MARSTLWTKYITRYLRQITKQQDDTPVDTSHEDMVLQWEEEVRAKARMKVSRSTTTRSRPRDQAPAPMDLHNKRLKVCMEMDSNPDHALGVRHNPQTKAPTNNKDQSLEPDSKDQGSSRVRRPTSEPKVLYGSTDIRYRNANSVLMEAAKDLKATAKDPRKPAKHSKTGTKVQPGHKAPCAAA